jgi:RND family efflux transporter MFP subunit
MAMHDHLQLTKTGEYVQLMKTFTLRLKPSYWVILSLLTLSFFGCNKSKKALEKEDNSGVQVVPVEVAVAARTNLAVLKTYSGTLEGEDQANIVAKISERITAINVHVGESIQTGNIAITLDKSGASSQYYQAEANFKNTQKNLERMKSLYSEGAISQQALDGSQTAYDVAKANFDAARGAVELTAPISGVVTAVNVSTGDLAMPGAVLATIAKINRMKIIFNIGETDVMNLSLGQKVQVFSEANPNDKVQGQIVQLSKSADLRSRSFEIKAIFTNTKDLWFKPGMFCKVIVNISPRAKVLAVPNSAILSDGLQSRVYLVHKGRALQRIVQPGVTDGEKTEITQGLAESDTVTTVGVTNVSDSSLVSIVRH